MNENDLNIMTETLKEQARKLIWTLQGYFQFKGGEHAQKGIQMLCELEGIVNQL